jgi:general secretion pathway protein G
MYMMSIINKQDGFTLVEMVMVIIIIAVLGGIAVMKIGSSIETSKFEATRSEMDQLALAIAGNAVIEAAGARSDFGYIGDIGALPPNLDALAANPGFATWDGPYISSNIDSDDFKKDAWGMAYVYFNTTLRSVGSGSNIDKAITSSSADLLNNTISGYLLDADVDMPGTDYRDSLEISLLYPDGTGNITTTTIYPDANGSFYFSGIPVGNHLLRVVYIPDSDTVEYDLSVNPASGTYLDIVFPTDLW